MPTSFGYKCAWIAVKSDAPLTVATALGLQRAPVIVERGR